MRWHLENGSALRKMEAELDVKATEVDAYNEALAERCGLNASEAQGEELVDAQCDARDAVFDCPAPDLAGVNYKLRLLGEHSHLAGETDPDSPLARIAADVARLASN